MDGPISRRPRETFTPCIAFQVYVISSCLAPFFSSKVEAKKPSGATLPHPSFDGVSIHGEAALVWSEQLK